MQFIIDLLAPIGTKGLRIAVVRLDGVVLASLPHDERSIGRPAIPSTFLAQPSGVAFDSAAGAERLPRSPSGGGRSIRMSPSR